MARRFLATTTVLAAVVFLAGVTGVPDGPAPAAGQASSPVEPACSTASLDGPYGVLIQGFAAGAPFHGIGLARFDGKGKASGRFDETVNGVLDPSTFSGEYAVNADCSGFIQFTEHHHERLPDHLHRVGIVLVDGGREGFFLLLDSQTPGETPPGSPEPSFTISGTFKHL